MVIQDPPHRILGNVAAVKEAWEPFDQIEVEAGGRGRRGKAVGLFCWITSPIKLNPKDLAVEFTIWTPGGEIA
jgi:hypothetical protein